jgi:RNA polymerase sigma factor (sigma-70 family)
MKNYDAENFNRFKKDIEKSVGKDKFALVESIARSFNTNIESIGMLTLEDLIQEGMLGLIKATSKIDQDVLDKSTDSEKVLKAFLSKRIKGAIRRAIDINKTCIGVPEYKITEMRKNPWDNVTYRQTHMNSNFISLDNEDTKNPEGLIGYICELDDVSYTKDLLTEKLIELMDNFLTPRERKVLQLSYGIDCEKLGAKEIALEIGLHGRTAYVRVSEIKNEALAKLNNNVLESQFADLL